MKNPDFDTLSIEGFREFLGEIKANLEENDMTFSDLVDFSPLEAIDFQSFTHEEEKERPVSVEFYHWNLAIC